MYILIILFYCNFMSTSLLFILNLYVTKIILNGIVHCKCPTDHQHRLLHGYHRVHKCQLKFVKIQMYLYF